MILLINLLASLMNPKWQPRYNEKEKDINIKLEK